MTHASPHTLAQGIKLNRRAGFWTVLDLKLIDTCQPIRIRKFLKVIKCPWNNSYTASASEPDLDIFWPAQLPVLFYLCSSFSSSSSSCQFHRRMSMNLTPLPPPPLLYELNMLISCPCECQSCCSSSITTSRSISHCLSVSLLSLEMFLQQILHTRSGCDGGRMMCFSLISSLNCLPFLWFEFWRWWMLDVGTTGLKKYHILCMMYE